MNIHDPHEYLMSPNSILKHEYVQTLRSGATNILSSFLGRVCIVHRVKQRARKAAVSIRTVGVLCSSDVAHDSLIGSNDV